jgi:phospholipase C
MLVIVFDEHGGFYDHVSPPATAPTGDDTRYASNKFAFDHLGVRVPAIVISAYTQQGTVIGNDAGGSPIVFDHTSVLATVERRFGLLPLTKRDAAARTLEMAINLKDPRISSADAPITLPEPAKDTFLKNLKSLFAKAPAPASDDAPLSTNQKSFLALALACDLQISDASKHEAMKKRHEAIGSQKEAARYMQEVDDKIHARRKVE